MLKSIIDRIELKQVEYPELDYLVFDDGSDFDLATIVPVGLYDKRNTNGGKKNFWLQWSKAIGVSRSLNHENYVFIPDDFLNLDIDDLMVLADTWKDLSYSLNIINDGRTSCWGNHREGIKPISYNGRIISEVGFNDCGFMTNRSVLEQIEITPVPDDWFDHPDKSSGVGHQLTKQMRELGIPMLAPDKSFATHGEHESVMHPGHRKDVKLKSK